MAKQNEQNYSAYLMKYEDIIKFSKKHDKSFFTGKDEFQYRLVITLWIDMWDSLYRKGVSMLANSLKHAGLINTIAAADEAALSVMKATPDIGIFSRVAFSMLSLTDETTVLQLLRFPKRFTWISAETTRLENRDKFLSQNNSVKLFDRKGIPNWVSKELKAISNSFVRKSDGIRSIDPISDLPSGTVAEGNLTKAEKYAMVDLALFGGEGSLPQSPLWTAMDIPSRCSVVRFVPKNYKTSRVIAMEPTYYQWLMAGVSKGLDDLLQSRKGTFHPGGRIDLHDQQRNRDLAILGSRDGRLSTIDLSAASDSISTSVAYSCLPERFWKAFEWTAEEAAIEDSHGNVRRHRLYLVATMGSRLTFPLETLVFWCIVCLAAKLYSHFTSEPIDGLLDMSAVYGDDIICPTSMASTVIDLLEMCGMRVNKEKSFYDGDLLFRESCGVEARNGLDISSTYWPRRTITKDSVVELVELHNRLYAKYSDTEFIREYRAFLKGRWKKLQSVTDPERFGLLDAYPVFVSKGRLPFDQPPEGAYAIPSNKVSYSNIESKPVTNSGLNLDSIAQEMAYYEFLKEGPQYQTELDRLLLVSTRRDYKAYSELKASVPRLRIEYDWDLLTLRKE